ncbi:MAG: hypothetical protein IK955_00515 [Clostridia bacterium]|nr:hypothetical protein [Clostridia bacterium]
MDFSAIWATISAPPIPAIVVATFAILFIIYVYIAKVINSKKKVEEPAKTPVASKTPAIPSAIPAGPAASSGDLELVGTDEKTAAVIMAIVSDKSGIPLNRLQFKSIALMEEK